MAKVSQERLARYREMDRELFQVQDPELREWITMAMSRGLRLGTQQSPRKHTGFFQTPFAESANSKDIAFIGIPMDINAMGTGGTRHGPQAIRQQSMIDCGMMHDVTENIPLMQCDTVDLGDVIFSRTDLETRLDDIYRTFKAAAEAGAYTFGVGGEHTSTYAILKALSEVHDDSFALIHFDAHGDTMPSFEGDRVNDGSCLRYGVLEGSIDPEKTIQVGIRNSYSKLIWDFSHETGMTVITGQELHEKGSQYVIDKIREIVGKDKTYFTFDSDGLCASYMYGTTNPELWGITAWQARDIMLGCRGLNIIGCDYMEHNPQKDTSGYSTLVSTMMCFELFALLADSREQAMGKKNPTTWA